MRKLLMIVILLGSSSVHANNRIDSYFSRYQVDISFSFHELGFEVPGRSFSDSGFAYSLSGGLSTYCVN